MQKAAHTLTLLPQQTRVINAAEGMQLEVQSGCLWLTRPGDPADHFLVAGERIALQQNLVLIQSDRHPGARSLVAARYTLVPLAAISRASAATPASDKSSVAKLAWGAPSACLFMERR